ncbi:hypothetical protein O1L55_30810, partial [Streptomyces albulus]|nr:hypothetical protein [Streptomyces noursei]
PSTTAPWSPPRPGDRRTRPAHRRSAPHPPGFRPARRPPGGPALPGQGAQHPGMGEGWYAHLPVFRAELDACAELLAPHLGLDLRDAPPAPARLPRRAARPGPHPPDPARPVRGRVRARPAVVGVGRAPEAP